MKVPKDVGDHNIELSTQGWEQGWWLLCKFCISLWSNSTARFHVFSLVAFQVGRTLGPELFTPKTLIFCSPYMRTRQTLEGIIQGSGKARDDPNLRVYEDPRLREVEFGYAVCVLRHVVSSTSLSFAICRSPLNHVYQEAMPEPVRATHGWFYYRFPGGESPADCFDRTSSFLESMMRQVRFGHAQDCIRRFCSLLTCSVVFPFIG